MVYVYKGTRTLGTEDPRNSGYANLVLGPQAQKYADEDERAEARREAWRESSRRYRQENPDKIRAYNDAWRAENREKVAEGQRRRYWEDPEKVRAYKREYREANKDRINARRRELRAMKKQLTHTQKGV